MQRTMITASPFSSTSSTERIKAALLTQGVFLSPKAKDALWNGGWKVPQLVRSGMSGGLEFYLEHQGYRIAISCSFSIGSPLAEGLGVDYADGFFLHDAHGDKIGIVDFFPSPSYYKLITSSGKSMASIGQQCFTRLAIGVYGICAFATNPAQACAFCAIKNVGETDAQHKTDQDILETVAAVRESELSECIETIMLGGGTPSTPDRGAARFAKLASKIATQVSWRITAMMVPPASDDDLRRMRDGGIQEVSINLEFGSEEAFGRYTPGKQRMIGHRRYEDSLDAAVAVFGAGNVQSLLVIGLEDYEVSLDAVRRLIAKKVIPVLSPFRPLPGTSLGSHLPPDADDIVDFYNRAKKLAHQHDWFLGPRCIPCQCNTMTLPWDVK